MAPRSLQTDILLPMPTKSDHLQLHGGRWRAVMAIPKEVRSAFGGKSYFIKPLATPDLNKANRLKGAWLTKWRTEVALERRAENGGLGQAQRLGRRFVSGNDQQAEDAFIIAA